MVQGTGHSPFAKNQHGHVPFVPSGLRYMAWPRHEPEQKIRQNFLRMVHGGGGGIRTRVPKYQIKSLYMFIPLFNLPAETSAGGISDGQPFKASSDTLKANES